MPCPLTPRVQPGSRSRPRLLLWGSLALAVLLLTGGVAAAQATASSAAERLRAWGDGARLELLPLRQSSLEVLARSHVTLVLEPHDLPRPTAVLLMTLPPTLDAAVMARHLRLCRIAPPRGRGPVRCLQVLPLRLTLQGESLRLEPGRSLQPDQAYGLDVLLRNPLQQGFHPLRLFALDPQRPAPEYLGTWLLQTDAQSD